MVKKHRAPGAGRPPAERQPVVINLKLLLYPGQDDDLIAALAKVPARQRANTVKATMRSGRLIVPQVADLPDDDDLDDALDNLTF
jgi:hypothetical protein